MKTVTLEDVKAILTLKEFQRQNPNMTGEVVKNTAGFILTYDSELIGDKGFDLVKAASVDLENATLQHLILSGVHTHTDRYTNQRKCFK